jgi:hypothetical protein
MTDFVAKGFHYYRDSIDDGKACSLVVLTAETGEAWQLGWRIPARRAFGKSGGMESIRACVYSLTST